MISEHEHVWVFESVHSIPEYIRKSIGGRVEDYIYNCICGAELYSTTKRELI